MPPKGGGNAKKDINKKAAKVAEDRTFGLKNKNKSKKVQQYVQAVQKQVGNMVEQRLGAGVKTEEQKRAEQAKQYKAEQAKMEKELALLFKQSIKQPPCPPGIDPKSIVCEFFKAGVCDKGARCKFAHDLTVQRKSAKVDMYSDRREGGGEDGAAGAGAAGAEPDKKEDAMENWDQTKLEQVVKTKHGAEHVKSNKTDIVCKFFLDAIEKEQYGWFWVCPAGGDACKYRHALPPGYVFKSRKAHEADIAAKLEAEQNATDITETIEEERSRLPSTGLTPVTAETFAVWKTARDARKRTEMVAAQEEEAKKGGVGRDFKVLSGRALFMFNSDLFKDDENADDDRYSDNPVDEDDEDRSRAGGAAAAAQDDDGEDNLEDLEEEEEEEEEEGGDDEDGEGEDEAGDEDEEEEEGHEEEPPDQ